MIGAMAILIVMALSWLPVTAQRGGGGLSPMSAEAASDSLTVSLITCWPGPEVYELCGHEAIRVRGEGRDSVWNYGVFDFRAPNFVYRFVKGETDYICAGYPFEWFLPEYIDRGSRVTEQDLNLTQEEARRLLKLLQTEALPENRTYRYNYVKDNCATRILDRVDDAIDGKVDYPDSVRYGTFRNEMRAYHKDYPWYQFGIDLALGSGIDYPLTSREEMFVPVEMKRNADTARLPDGRPLVRATRVINEGVADATLGPTPWWATPMFWSCMVMALLLAVGIYDIKRKRITGWVYAIWYAVLGIAGTIVWFLVFISSHEATSPNTLALWLTPFQLLLALGIVVRRLRVLAVALAWYDIVATACTLLVWPFQHQSGNPAIFPLLVATLVVSAVYAIIAPKDSYSNRTKKPERPRSSSARRKGDGVRKPGPSRSGIRIRETNR